VSAVRFRLWPPKNRLEAVIFFACRFWEVVRVRHVLCLTVM
ncbi:hypothetical protein, partial [Neisseria meningitidis serogroup B]